MYIQQCSLHAVTISVGCLEQTTQVMHSHVGVHLNVIGSLEMIGISWDEVGSGGHMA